MRYLFLLIILFVFSNIRAQSATDTKSIKAGLTTEEFQIAKQYQSNKLESFTFRQYAKLTKDMSLKLNGYDPFYEIREISTISDDSIKTIAVNKIKDNIKKTKFTSVKEFTDMMDEIKYLAVRTEQENWEFYELIKKANFGQHMELMDPETDYMLNVTIGYK